MYSVRGQDSGYEDEESELHTACESGSLSEILNCLQSSESDIAWYHEGQTPLHVAVLSGRGDVCDVITILLDYGADINAETLSDGNTALHLAVVHGSYPKDFELVMILLEHEADVSLRNKALRTPYDCAIASGQYELAGTLNGTIPPDKAREYYRQKLGERYGPYIIEAVLESDERALHHNIGLGGDPNTLNRHGAGAIHYAVTHSDLPVYDTLSTLLEAGTDPNLRDEEGDSALNLVIKSQHLRDNGQMTRCVQLLYDSGGKSDIRDLDGKDACALAEEKGYDDVLMILRRQPAKQPPLNKRESKKSVIIKEPPIIEEKVKEKEKEKVSKPERLSSPSSSSLAKPSSPALLPTSSSLPKIPLPLPSPSPPPSHPPSSSLEAVQPVPAPKEAAILPTDEAPPSAAIETQEGEEDLPTPRTPRDDVNAPNAEGLCPIHVATLMENEILRHSKINVLIGKGAEVSKTVEATGNTALHLCAEKDYGTTATVLLDHHIDYTVKNNNGKTAYELAQDLGHDSVIEAIKEKQGEVQDNWKRAGKKAKFCTIL